MNTCFCEHCKQARDADPEMWSNQRLCEEILALCSRAGMSTDMSDTLMEYVWVMYDSGR